MLKATHEWKVLDHGSIVEVDQGLWTVVGTTPMPMMHLPRRMTLVRLRDGGLLIWSAIALHEESMAELERLGRPAFLVVPSDHHRRDAAAWKARYPSVRVVTPFGSRAKTTRMVPVDTTNPDFGDPSVRFLPVSGTNEEEAALEVRRPGGLTLVLNDIVGNVRSASGFGGWLMRRMGIAGDEARVPKAMALLLIRNKQSLAVQLRQWAEISDLRRIIVSHGDIIEEAPRQVLRSLASSLD